MEERVALLTRNEKDIVATLLLFALTNPFWTSISHRDYLQDSFCQSQYGAHSVERRSRTEHSTRNDREGSVPPEQRFPGRYVLTLFAEGTWLTCPAESLAQHEQIHARLQLEIMDVKEEIEVLEQELRRDQDPGKMSRIQSQIGVSGVPTMAGSFTYSVTDREARHGADGVATHAANQCDPREGRRG